MIVKILFLLTCVFCTIDTRLFVYPSLSRSLLMETGLLAIAFEEQRDRSLFHEG